MNWDTIQQFLRILLQFGAGLLVKQGLITDSMATTAVGALLSLGGIVWWVFWNKGKTAPAPAPTP